MIAPSPIITITKDNDNENETLLVIANDQPLWIWIIIGAVCLLCICTICAVIIQRNKRKKQFEEDTKTIARISNPDKPVQSTKHHVVYTKPYIISICIAAHSRSRCPITHQHNSAISDLDTASGRHRTFKVRTKTINHCQIRR